MKIYVGGQIKEKYRGEEGNSVESVTITREKNNPIEFGAFMYPLGSEEFNHLTGAKSLRSPVERIYMGLSHDAGEYVLTKIDGLVAQHLTPNSVERVLEEVDEEIIIPGFLKKEGSKLPNLFSLERIDDATYRVSIPDALK